MNGFFLCRKKPSFFPAMYSRYFFTLPYFPTESTWISDKQGFFTLNLHGLWVSRDFLGNVPGLQGKGKNGMKKYGKNQQLKEMLMQI